jgi:hypothetical protein
VRWAVLTNPGAPPTSTRVVRSSLLFARRQLHEAFAAELDPLDDPTRDEVLDALEIEADPVVWRLRRVQQELTADECRAVVERTILSLLHGARAAGAAEVTARSVEPVS